MPFRGAKGGLFVAEFVKDPVKIINKSFKKWDKIQQKKLKKALKGSVVYLKKKMVDYAPSGRSGRGAPLKTLIKDLPIGTVRRKGQGISIFLNKRGSITITLNIRPKKHAKIRWVNDGTGIYGPNRKLIRPRKSEFLYFEVDGQLIRTRSVRGQPGQKFIQKAVNVSKLIIARKIQKAFRI